MRSPRRQCAVSCTENSVTSWSRHYQRHSSNKSQISRRTKLRAYACSVTAHRRHCCKYFTILLHNFLSLCAAQAGVVYVCNRNISQNRESSFALRIPYYQRNWLQKLSQRHCFWNPACSKARLMCLGMINAS